MRQENRLKIKAKTFLLMSDFFERAECDKATIVIDKLKLDKNKMFEYYNLAVGFILTTPKQFVLGVFE